MAAAYPVVADVHARLGAAGVELTPDRPPLAASALAGAIAEFERRTNRTPMLAPAGTVTRQLDPPVAADGVLHLDRDLATLVSVAYQPQGGASTTLTSTQYLAEPVNAAADGRPYERIVFSYQNWLAPLWYPQRGAIYVAGRWGYTTTLPDDAWEAMVVGACLRLFPTARVAGRVPPHSVSRNAGDGAGGAVQLAYGTPTTDQVAAWQAQWAVAVANYRRISI